MYLQTSSAARFHIHCPTHFSASSNTFITFPGSGSVSRQILGSITEPGFCRSAKRLPGTKTGMRNHGGGDFVGCRCQGQRVGGDEEGSDDDDGFYIRRAVELARKAIGCTSPNPMVGCVIVKDGKVVGEGFHPKAGQPHAEVFALRDAGDLAENATAYVSLEPCNHYGRTPPCTEALIKAKVKRVVVGMVDPNPIVASKGVDRLRDAGIHVTVGVEEEMCKKLNEAYIHQMLKGKPFVALRYSISVDGHFIDQLSEEDTETDEYYSQLLQEYDAIVLSSTSITEQFPFPSSKQLGPSQPLHIVIARNPGFQIPLQDTEANSKLIIFTDKESTVGPETGAPAGIETVVLNKIDLVSILDYCKRRGLCSVLLDVRGNSEDYQEILKEGFEQNLLQKVLVEVVPIWNGNNEQSLPVALTGLNQRVRNLTSRNLSRSVLLEGYFD